MALDSEEELKERIKSTSVKYTEHFEKDVNPERDNINKEIIENKLGNPDSLVHFENQPDEHYREKYDLYFDKSNKYLLRIIVSFSSDKKYLYVITSHVINRKRLELQRRDKHE